LYFWTREATVLDSELGDVIPYQIRVKKVDL